MNQSNWKNQILEGFSNEKKDKPKHIHKIIMNF